MTGQTRDLRGKKRLTNIVIQHSGLDPNCRVATETHGGSQVKRQRQSKVTEFRKRENNG
jgi:hypothetical protein